jgi:hypothetical protein
VIRRIRGVTGGLTRLRWHRGTARIGSGHHKNHRTKPGTGSFLRMELGMRIGTSLAEPAGPDPLGALADQIRAAADDGFASAWMSNIFGLEALTSLAVAGRQVPGIELGTAVWVSGCRTRS